MTHRTLILCLFVTIMTNVLLASQSMVSIGGWVQPKTQPDIKSNQFVFIDFWATWCGPCIKAMEHIEELKKVTDDKVFFISLSNEPFNTVDQFLERKGIKSTVAIDYENATFNTFNIESLPQGVLIAPDGSIVWKGMPSEMSFDKIKSIIRTYYKPIPVKKKLKSFNIKPARSQQIVIKKNKFQDIIIQWGIVNEPVEFYKGSDSNTIKYTGTLAQILADIWHIPQNAISISPDIMLAPSYTFEFIPTQNSSHHDLSSGLLHVLGLSYQKSSQTDKGYALRIVDEWSLWSSEIYNYSSDGTPTYLISENTLEIDNHNLEQLAMLLSNTLKIPFYIDEVYSSTHDINDVQDVPLILQPYDWSLDITNVENLLKQLSTEYGVGYNPKNVDVPIYHIVKKLK